MSFGIRTPSGLPGSRPLALFGVAGELQSDEERNPAEFVVSGEVVLCGLDGTREDEQPSAESLRSLPPAEREVPAGIDWVRGRRVGELSFRGGRSLGRCFGEFIFSRG